MNRTYPATSTALFASAIAACATVPAQPNGETIDAIYFGGSIITMEGDAPRYVEAVAVSDGKIAFVGNLKDAEALGAAKQRIDLGGKTLLPGFIDAHGHAFFSGVQKLSANLLPPPDGQGMDVASLVKIVSDWKAKNAGVVEKSGWILGFGYDDSQLAENRHPTATELDAISTEHAVLFIHQSGHLAALNHKALQLVGLDAETPDPVGGVVRREADGRTPNGVVEEMAFFAAIFKVLGALDEHANEAIALAGLRAYTEFGFTTAQEGRATKGASETWRQLANQNRLPIDIAVYPDLQAETAYMKEVGVRPSYDHHFRIAGVKLSFDGSPQGKTAWLSQPYLNPPPGQPKTYAGYPAIPKAEERQRLVDLAFENNWQLLVHCNGDAAAEAMIEAVGQAEAKFGNADRRTVMIHAQTVREDQIDRMKALAITPSFFSMHTYYWGDWHRDETLGKERAYRISPTASVIARGMKLTEHHDAPVALPSAMMILHTTVNRTSRSGDVIGPDERISPFLALKTITEWAAWQYFEEDRKGTLTPGKLADFVILDKDPIEVDPATIADIKVVETIKEGQVVYSASEMVQ